MVKKSIKESWKIVKRNGMLMLAIGLLLGASFNAVITSLANDVIMASIAKLWSAESVEKWTVKGIKIGKFIGSVISFLIVSLIVFITMTIIFFIKNWVWKIRTKRHPELLIEKPIEPTVEEKILLQLEEINKNLTINKGEEKNKL